MALGHIPGGTWGISVFDINQLAILPLFAQSLAGSPYLCIILGYLRIRSLSFDRSIASSKASSPENAILCFPFRIQISTAFFIVVPCILITSRFFSPTNALLY